MEVIAAGTCVLLEGIECGCQSELQSCKEGHLKMWIVTGVQGCMRQWRCEAGATKAFAIPCLTQPMFCRVSTCTGKVVCRAA